MLERITDLIFHDNVVYLIMIFLFVLLLSSIAAFIVMMYGMIF